MGPGCENHICNIAHPLCSHLGVPELPLVPLVEEDVPLQREDGLVQRLPLQRRAREPLQEVVPLPTDVERLQSSIKFLT